jgi:ATP-dependent Lon protease
MNDADYRMMPLLPLRGVTVFPNVVIHLDVGREQSMAALEYAMVNSREILLVAQRDAQEAEPDFEGLYTVGTLAEVKQLIKLPGGAFRVLVEGLQRAGIQKVLETNPFYLVQAHVYADEDLHTREEESAARDLTAQFESYVKLDKRMSPEMVVAMAGIEESHRLADYVAAQINLKLPEKQAILETFDVRERLEKLSLILGKEIELMELEKKIHMRVRKQMDKNQKEYYLREQVKAIQKELGDKEERAAESDEYREKLAAANLPEEAMEKALKEVERLEKMPPMVAEAAVVRNYLDWLLMIPWNSETEDMIDILEAAKILDEDHYALEAAKERIIEYLAVRKLAADTVKGPILCLTGPPGVGKTSLAKSVARALGRKFVRMSLGGVRDEAEIRGHRRTYVGAMPGRIIQGLRTAGTKNPVFLLDEVDKMSVDFRGDPSAALLEVLDPEQNNTFSDHFVEVEVDLSKVLFITTANVSYNIPRPLLDRMEMIPISGYTEDEKLNIAKRYLWPKQIREHGLKKSQIKIRDAQILTVIQRYTREAGVRGLEREIASICRKTARIIAEGKKKQVTVNEAALGRFLGIPRYRHGESAGESLVGIATGLAWTEMGGEILQIEVTLMKGSGKLILTGKLGDVMKESAQAGFSYVRSRAFALGIREDFYEKYDVHIHIPEGAIPKDGPSAGITMACALISALTGRRILSDVAMTGEITLRGRILPVGGIKEKVLAAHRAGSRVIILPEENKKDLENIPDNIKESLKFVLAADMDSVLGTALEERR